MTTLRNVLITFDAIAAARDPEVRKQLLEMAKADKNSKALRHARNVIRRAKNPRRKARALPRL